MSSIGVYFVRNRKSGKVYIGSSMNMRARLNKHKNHLQRGVHPNEYLQRAFSLHGEAAFEFGVLEQCAAADRLVREQQWIDRLSSTNEKCGYNLIPTRTNQLYGKALAVHQRKGWAAFSKAERQQIAKHLIDPAVKAKAQALANIARATPEHSAIRREIAKRTLTTAATRRKNSERLKLLWQDPVYRAARVAGLDRGRAKTNTARKKRSHDEIVSSVTNNEVTGAG